MITTLLFSKHSVFKYDLFLIFFFFFLNNVRNLIMIIRQFFDIYSIDKINLPIINKLTFQFFIENL